MCAVIACERQRSGKASPYCLQHWQRRGRQIREGTFPGDEMFQAVTRAVSKTFEVSLRGLTPLVAAEVLYGLQERVRGGTKIPPWHVRLVCEQALAERASTLADLDPAGLCKRGRRVLTAFTTAARRLGMTPESERHKDVWDATAFGLSGTIRFTEVRQPWLREALKATVCEELPRRRGSQLCHRMQNHINAFVRLSDSLHLQCEDHGAHPALLNRQDIVNFSNRLAFLTESGEMSVYTWIALARMVRKWLELMHRGRPPSPGGGAFPPTAIPLEGQLTCGALRQSAHDAFKPEVPGCSEAHGYQGGDHLRPAFGNGGHQRCRHPGEEHTEQADGAAHRQNHESEPESTVQDRLDSPDNTLRVVTGP
ncbi:hypothetical protein J7I98_39785 [Streptomyces sp. ISL-98]|uniref:hypothetical protein n=1 Tax=Streptomyces sp. ISL-98 TaxID=2819192 RepID=UPI001BE53891|nr:hypothetical protein [Streptomyces sp. ISL-98]MBT2511801.1 hypothetical protein [Streptomyces sp. ISL-98]